MEPHDSSKDLTIPELAPDPVRDEAAIARVAQVASEVATVRDAAARFATLTAKGRGAIVERFARALLDDADALAGLLCEETGKPEAEAWLHEVLPIASLGEHWARKGPDLLAPTEVPLSALDFPGKRAAIELRPRGVVALITPANYPLAIPLRTLFPALLAGNGVVWKPAERTTRIARRVEAIARSAVGHGLVRVIEGGPEAGAAILGAGIDSVVFVGGERSGIAVAKRAAESLVPCTLELGGKDVAIVLDDAPIDRTAAGLVFGAITNAGQNCAAIERAVVTKKAWKALGPALDKQLRALVPGRDYGPLGGERDVARVEGQLEQTCGRVQVGGKRLDREGPWFAPTLVVLDAPDGPLWTEETFGPVLPVVVVADEEEAAEVARATRYGLSASVWTRDIAKASRLGDVLRVGVLTMNDHAFSASIPGLPWGGPGATGSGVTGSVHALSALTVPRAVVLDRGAAKRELYWYPYTRGLGTIGRALVRLRSRSTPLGARVVALLRLLIGFATRYRTR